MKAFITQENNKIFEIAVGVFFLLLFWQIISMVVGNNVLFPSPLATIEKFFEILQRPDIFKIFSSTIIRVAIGLILAFFFAIFLGIASIYIPIIEIMFRPLISAIKAMPNISIIVQIIIWLGTLRAPSAVSFLVVFPLLYSAVIEGIKNVDESLLEMANLYRVSSNSQLKNIYLPSVISYLAASFGAAVGLAVKMVIAAEYLSHTPSSIGERIYFSRIYFDMSGVMAWTIVAIITSLVLEVPSKMITKHFSRWKDEK
jgi:NitT/TauT family transport system permease protein